MTTNEMIEYLKAKSKLPYCEIYFHYNEHLGHYETIEEKIQEIITDGFEDDVVDKDECIKKKSLWGIMWYPNTPNGFEEVFASELDIALKKMCEIADGHKK